MFYNDACNYDNCMHGLGQTFFSFAIDDYAFDSKSNPDEYGCF